MSYSDIQAQFNSYSLQCFPVGKAGWPKDMLGKTELSRANSLIPRIPASNPPSLSEATRSSSRWTICSLPWRSWPRHNLKRLLLTRRLQGGTLLPDSSQRTGAVRESRAARLCHFSNSGLTSNFPNFYQYQKYPRSLLFWITRKSHKIFTVAELQDSGFLKEKVKC